MGSKWKIKVLMKDLRVVFGLSNPELNAHIVRMSVLYEDLKLELTGSGSTPIERLEFYGKSARQQYFIRRTFATLYEFRECFVRLDECDEFQHVKRRIETDREAAKRWNDCVAFFRDKDNENSSPTSGTTSADISARRPPAPSSRSSRLIPRRSSASSSSIGTSRTTGPACTYGTRKRSPPRRCTVIAAVSRTPSGARGCSRFQSEPSYMRPKPSTWSSSSTSGTDSGSPNVVPRDRTLRSPTAEVS